MCDVLYAWHTCTFFANCRSSIQFPFWGGGRKLSRLNELHNEHCIRRVVRLNLPFTSQLVIENQLSKKAFFVLSYHSIVCGWCVQKRQRGWGPYNGQELVSCWKVRRLLASESMTENYWRKFLTEKKCPEQADRRTVCLFHSVSTQLFEYQASWSKKSFLLMSCIKKQQRC